MQKIRVSFILLQGLLGCRRWCNILRFRILWDVLSQGNIGLNWSLGKFIGIPLNKAGLKPPGPSSAPTYPSNPIPPCLILAFPLSTLSISLFFIFSDLLTTELWSNALHSRHSRRVLRPKYHQILTRLSHYYILCTSNSI